VPGFAHASISGQSDASRFAALYQLLTALSQARTTADVYEAAISSLLEATAADRAAVLIFDDGVVRCKASRGLSEEFLAGVSGYSSSFSGALASEPLIIPDALAAGPFAPSGALFAAAGIRSLILVPLPGGGVSGEFMLCYEQPHESNAAELEVASAIASHVAAAVQQKRAEQSLIRSEQQLHAILDNSATIIFLKDMQGRYLLINKRFEEVFHVTKEDVLGRTDYEIFPPELAQRFQANDRAVLAAGKPLSVEEYAPHDDGLHAYISTKFPLEEPDGAVTGVCGITTDITDRKRLQAADEYLAAIVESSDDAIIGKNLNGIITSWNKGAQQVFGYTAAEVLGLPVSMLAAPGHANEMPEILAQIRRGIPVQHYETRRRRKDGQVIDVALTVSPVRNSAGEIVGASKIARDITGRKAAERERSVLLAREKDARQTAELLNRAASRLAAQLDLEKLVQEVTDIATALVGAEFGSFFHNAVNEKGESYTLYTLSGVSREAFGEAPMPRTTELFSSAFGGQGVVRSDDLLVDPRFGKSVPHYAVLAGRVPVRSYLSVPVIARTGEVLGGLFFGHSEPGRFAQKHEEIMAGVAAQAAIAMDNARLFEQAQWAQLELKRANEELRRANKDLEVFAYSASHDLKDPLRTIAISAQLIERSWGRQLQGDDAAFLSNILNAAHRMGALIQDLLSYARATKYEEGPPPRVDSAHVLAQVLESLRGPLTEAGAEVTAGPLPVVAMHEARLSQLFQNLVSNAIKYRSQEPPRIHIAAEQRDGWCVFSVSDNGIGIAPQFAEQIFGLFKRLHNHDEYPGSGIGLAICQRIVEQYDGRIWLEHSAPGRGATFCFSIPWRVP
jgi:PAS domain S-box-containing protein